MKKIVPIVLFCLCIMLSCTTHTYTPDFLTDDTIRLEVGKKRMFTYTPSECQYAYNLDRHEFRAHTDNMSDYFIVRLNETPTREAQEVMALSMEWTERNGMNKSKKNIVLQVVKLEDNTFWLWNSRDGIKVTVRFE